MKARDKEYGPAYPAYCNRCQNDSLFHLGKVRQWFHLYWIPLIPWKAERLLYCQICGEAIELERDEFKRAIDLVNDTQRYRERELSEEEYEQILSAFEARAPSLQGPATAEELPRDERVDEDESSGEPGLNESPDGPN